MARTRSRVRLPVASVTGWGALLLAALPLVASARNTHAYRLVEDWPVPSARLAELEYGLADITGVAADAQGRVFVTAGTGDPVLVFDREGNILSGWGDAALDEPHCCRIDAAGTVWVADFKTHMVIRFSPEGRVLGSHGRWLRPGENRKRLNQPTDVAFGPDGDVYVADGYGNSRIVRLSPTGRFLGDWGRRGRRPGQFRTPHSIAVDAQGRVFVADRANRRVQVFSREGRFLAQWPAGGEPWGLFITPGQELYLADGNSKEIRVYDLEGRQLAAWGRSGTLPVEIEEPHMLCVDDQGALYVADARGRRVLKFVPE